MLTRLRAVAATPVSSEEKGCKIINSTRLYYEIKGEGQPLLFIHGFTLDNKMWDNQFHYFSKNHRCIRFDIRGFGQSALPGSQPYTYQEDIKSLLQSLEIVDPVIVVGHSIGGLAAINFALRYPHYTKALALVSTEVEGYEFKNFSTEQISRQAKSKTIEFARRKWLNHEIFASAKKNKVLAECLDQMLHRYSGWHFVSDNPLVGFNPLPWKILDQVQIPTLVINGSADLPDFKEISDGIVAKIARSKQVSIPQSGNLSNMENPVVFNKELQYFLEAVTAD